jgi:hypothetical protein
MSTVAELLTLTDSLYPNAVTDANTISYMNMAQNEISPYFGLIAEDTTLYTVADNDSLALPTGIADISQIDTFDIYNEATDTDRIVVSASMKVGTYTIANQPVGAKRISVTHTAVGNTDTLGTITVAGTVDGTATTEVITPVANSTAYGNKFFDDGGITSITGASWVTNGTADLITVGVSLSRYDFTRYAIGYVDDVGYSGNIVYQIYSSAGVKSLVIYPTPTETGCNIRIRYRKALTALSASSTSLSPDFDSRFHDMLALYAAYMICSTGPSADHSQADRFMQQYDARLVELWKFSMEKDKKSMMKRRDNRQWH